MFDIDHDPTVRIKFIDDISDETDHFSSIVRTAAKCLDEKELVVECRHGEASFYIPDSKSMVWLYETVDGDIEGLMFRGSHMVDIEIDSSDIDVAKAATKLLKYVMAIC